MEHAVIMKDRSAVLTATPVIFICGDCGIEENSREGSLPAGWDRHQHKGVTVLRCGDCNEAIEREHRGLAVEGGAGKVEELPPLVVDEMRWTKLTERGWVYLYEGCRIQHWPIAEAGAVAIQITGGEQPGQATKVDDAVLFSVRAADLDDMIEHLQAVRASIVPAAPHLVAVEGTPRA
jgi:hypothetical protein